MESVLETARRVVAVKQRIPDSWTPYRNADSEYAVVGYRWGFKDDDGKELFAIYVGLSEGELRDEGSQIELSLAPPGNVALIRDGVYTRLEFRIRHRLRFQAGLNEGAVAGLGHLLQSATLVTAAEAV